MIDQQEVYDVGWAMRKFGGSFCKSLGQALAQADIINQERIKKAFPDYWKKYKELAKERKVKKL